MKLTTENEKCQIIVDLVGIRTLKALVQKLRGTVTWGLRKKGGPTLKMFGKEFNYLLRNQNVK